ncbi:MAG TPA: amidohydrolase [Dehalococcoidia bacterium]|nr:amidohydrolase [Dehalococcoidia bacterium]
MALDLTREAQAAAPEIVETRRYLHRHPELSFEEYRTAELIAAELRRAGYEVTEGVGKTGVVGLIAGDRPGKTVLVRADIDALPVQEVAGRPYGSETPDVMHACGHDAHVAIALQTAKLVARHRGELAGQVKFAFQPAEETIGGAEAMIEAGVLENPRPDIVIGLHVWSSLPAGVVGVKSGPLMASADEIRITIRGRSAHGAMPHQGVDPIVVAAHVITALQTIVSREVSPLEPACVTIGRIQGGTAYNIIPDQVELAGTVRAFDPALRQYLIDRVEALVAAVCAAQRAEYTFRPLFGCPAVRSDDQVAELVRAAAADVVGPDRVVIPDQTMGGDDVAFFLDAVPGCYFFLGGADPKVGVGPSHHRGDFDIDESCLPLGTAVLAGTVFRYLAGA